MTDCPSSSQRVQLRTYQRHPKFNTCTDNRKGKFVPVDAMKAYVERNSIAPLIFDLGTGWKRLVSFKHRPLYVRKRTSELIKYEAGRNPELILTVLEKRKSLATMGTRSYNKSQQDALFLKFILINSFTRFRQIYCPSSGVSTLYTQQLVFVILVMLTVC